MSQSIIRIDNHLICAATAPMVIPAGGAHVRQVEFRLPLFQHCPTVTATVYTDEGPGNPFAVWSIKINVLGAETQIAISAANVAAGVDVPYQYFCDIVVIGQAAELKTA